MRLLELQPEFVYTILAGILHLGNVQFVVTGEAYIYVTIIYIWIETAANMPLI